jgi:uncharacterized repeat protein (TIGR01451 family)
LLRISSFVAVVLFLVLSFQEPGMTGMPGGSLIQNTATITFIGSGNVSYGTVSNMVSITVSAVAALVVNPKESDSTSPSDAFAAGGTTSRFFTITNTGNLADAYVIQSTTPSAGSIVGVAYTDSSGNLSPVTLGQTVSPTVAPGQTQTVQVTFSTLGVPLGTHLKVTLVARTTIGMIAGGFESDTGTIVGIVSAGATWGSGNIVPQSFVNGARTAQVQGGATITYTMQFENYGSIAAGTVTMLDALPVGITVNASSVMLNGVSVSGARTSSQSINPEAQNGSATSGPPIHQVSSGQVLVIPIGSVAPMVPQVVSFLGNIKGSDSLGTAYINNATLEAAGLPPIVTTSTSIFIGTGSTIYDGTIGPSKVISGAKIELIGISDGMPIPLSGTALEPNVQSNNPFITGPDGQYSFGLGSTQFGYGGRAVTYDILITAPGYLNRKIQANLTPDTSGLFYSVTLTALDGQALAIPGGFSLSTLPVTLNDVYGIFGNFPLFSLNAVSISKTSDRSSASGGDRVVYTLNLSGNASTSLNQTEIVDTLPPGLMYAPRTGRLDAVAAEPTISGRNLTWTLATLNASHTITYATVVMPNVAPGTTLTNRVVVSAALPFDPNSITSASATCNVLITPGLFSDRIIITGRVFADVKDTGRFMLGDRGVAGVRIFLENGESVVTDHNGRYTFQDARPGMHVMRLDSLTLPKNVAAYPDRSYDSERSVRRLVHGIFDSGLMQDVNFALKAES